MSKSVRIDDVVVVPGGSVSIFYTIGESPLPLTPDGQAQVWAEKEQFVAALAAAEEALISAQTLYLLLLQCAVGYKQDPNIGAAFISRIKGKTATLDLTGAVSAIGLQ